LYSVRARVSSIMYHHVLYRHGRTSSLAVVYLPAILAGQELPV
jgi:hypothetical protein